MHDTNPYSSPGIDRSPPTPVACGEANRVTVQLSLDDLVAFNVLHAKLSNKRRAAYFLRWFIVPVILTLLGFLMAARNRPAPFGLAVGFWTVAACFLVLYPGGRKRTLRNLLSKASAANEHAALQEVTMTLLPEGIFRTSSSEDVLRRWHAVRSVVQTPDLGVIYIAPAVAYLVPRRFLASDVQFQEFMRLTLDHWARAHGKATSSS